MPTPYGPCNYYDSYGKKSSWGKNNFDEEDAWSSSGRSRVNIGSSLQAGEECDNCH
jgi:hypothetical protein